MLRFNEEEQEEIKSDLRIMIGFMEKVRELELDHVEPLLHMSRPGNSLRDDIPGNMITNAQALQNAPSTDGPFFIVPKVIKKPGA